MCAITDNPAATSRPLVIYSCQTILVHGFPSQCEQLSTYQHPARIFQGLRTPRKERARSGLLPSPALTSMCVAEQVGAQTACLSPVLCAPRHQLCRGEPQKAELPACAEVSGVALSPRALASVAGLFVPGVTPHRMRRGPNRQGRRVTAEVNF